MSNNLIIKDKYIYLKLYGVTTSDKLYYELLSKVKDILLKNKISNILFDIKEYEELQISLYTFYEELKNVSLPIDINIAIITNKNSQSNGFVTIMKMIADLKNFNFKIFYEDKDFEEWIEKLK